MQCILYVTIFTKREHHTSLYYSDVLLFHCTSLMKTPA